MGLVLLLTMFTIPVHGAARVVGQMEVLSANSARISLSWSDASIVEPIRITGWRYDEGLVEITYQTGAEEPEGLSSQIMRYDQGTFPMKMMLTMNNDKKSPFTDLDEGHSAYASVMNLYARGIISGYPDGSFKGDDPVTRTEFAKMLMTTAAYAKDQGLKSTFTDVDGDFWGKDYIMTLANKGIIKGKGEGQFDPQGAIKVGEVLAVITRTFDTYGTESYQGTLASHWSNDAYLKAVKEGIVLEEDDFYKDYKPEEKATRIQCAKMLSRVLEQLHEVQ